MKRHTRVYFDAFGYAEGDYIPSELSGDKSVDVHHIDCKGMGGDPSGEKDRIENLQALTRKEHDFFGDREHLKSFLYQKHKDFLEFNGVKYDESYLNAQIEKYSVVCS